MDKKQLNILLGVGAVVGGALLLRYLYKKSQVPDVLTIELSNLNNATQSFDYIIYKNDREFKKGTFNTRMPSEAFVQFKNKIQFDNNLKSITITGTSANSEQFKKLIKFKESNDPKVSVSQLEPIIIDIKPK